MSAGEIGWRLRAKAHQTLDGFLLERRSAPPALSDIVAGDGAIRDRLDHGATLIPLPAVGKVDLPGDAVERLRIEADALRAHRFSFFGLHDEPFGETINWNREYNAGRDIPLRYAPKIDYRDYDEVGDCKYAWEPSRFCHLVTLGRAYRVTGDERYAAEVVKQIDSWIEQCPFDRGMQWRSPMELSIRLINWVFALEMIRPSTALTDAALGRIVPVVYRHAWRVDRSYSRYSSANNHTIGEAAGVFITSLYFSFLRGAEAWRDRSRSLLIEAAREQTFADGVNREQATGYHYFVLEFFLLAGLLGRRAGVDFPDAYWATLERMFAFLAALASTGAPPMFGDADDGYVLAVGDVMNDPASFLPVGAVLFDRASFKRLAPEFSGRATWLLGAEGRKAFDQLATETVDGLPDDVPMAFPDAGYTILRDRSAATPPPLAVVFDCGNLGFRAIAAHGHADALSFTLSANGSAVLIDPGTYDYFTHPAQRRYFRGTQAHNTIVVDGQDQSEMLGPFLWGRRAEARCERSDAGPELMTVVGSHDGYRHLADPVTHRREIRLDPRRNRVDVLDTLEAEGTHEVEIWFHFAAHCRHKPAAANVISVSTSKANLTFSIDRALEVSTITGGDDPVCGWESRGYHHREPAISLVARTVIEGTTRFACTFELTGRA